MVRISLWIWMLMATLLSAEQPSNFHFTTVCNFTNREYFHRLEDSGKAMGLSLEILGQNQPWFGNITKFHRMEAFVANLPDDDIVLFSDAFDVFLVGSQEEIVAKFLDSGAKLIISTEKNCFPGEGIRGNPPRKTDFCYLNSGGYIGYAGFIKEFLRGLQPYEYVDDGHCLMYYFMKHPEWLTSKEVQFDQHCKIFLSLYLVPREDIEVQGQRLYLRPTDSYPCVIHGNGPAKDICFNLYSQIYGIGSLSLLSQTQRQAPIETSQFHMVSACNLPDHLYTYRLKDSAKALDLPLQILGQGEPWFGKVTKFRQMESFLQQVPDDDIVLFTDAFDVFALGKQEEIVEKFLKFNAQLVLSMEKNCFPEDGRRGNPTQKTDFCYLNSGGYIGYAGFIKAFLCDMQPYGHSNDQHCLMYYFSKHPEWLTNGVIQFDQYCEIFLSLFLVDKNDLEIRDNRIYVRPTGSYPCFVHGNGPAKESCFRLYNQVFGIDVSPLDPTDPKWAWMDRQIEEDFKGIREIKKSDVLLDAQKLQDLCLYHIHHGKVIGPECQTTRLLQEVCRRYTVPDLILLYANRDIYRGDELDSGGIRVPIFCSAKQREAEGRVIHFIDWYYDPALEEGGWNNILYEIDAKRTSYLWESKKPQLFWRGASTDARGQGSHHARLWDFPRGILVAKSLEYPHLIDARFSQIFNETLKNSAPPKAAWVSIADHLSYKYQIIMDGETSTYPGYQWRLYSGCLPLKQDSPDTLWFHNALTPGVHYLPVKRDLSDLVEKLSWAITHDEEAKAIAQRAQAFAKDNLMPEHMYLYAYKALLKYASLLQ